MDTATQTELSTTTAIKAAVTNARQGPRVELTMNGAQALLDAWEQAEHGGAPRSAAASANFYLAFLPELPGDNTPHIALWERDSAPDGILVGRLGIRRPVVRIGRWHLPMPQLRTLNITEGGLEARSAATAQHQADYLCQLLEGDTIDCISVFRVPVDSEPGRILAKGLRKPGDDNPEVIGHWYTELTDQQGCPILPNSAKTRSAFRRKDRKLVQTFNGRVETREIRGRDQLADFIKVAARIGAASYQQGIGIGVQDNAWWSKMLGIHADNGSFRGYWLEADGETIAYLVGTLTNGTFSLVATSFLPHYRAVGPGAYLLRRVIERLQQDRVRWLDYGVGDYSYKELHGTWRRENATLNFYGTSPTARLASILDTAGKRLNRVLYRALKAGGMLERLKRLRRTLAERSGTRRVDPPQRQ